VRRYNGLTQISPDHGWSTFSAINHYHHHYLHLLWNYIFNRRGPSLSKITVGLRFQQFSWTLVKKLPRPESKMWAESEAIARSVLAGYRVRGLAKSLYYHATYIKDPKWADTQHEVGQIGNHVFYNRAKGSNLAI
jgi:hypothetical protein